MFHEVAVSDRPDVALLVYDLRGSGVVRNTLRIARAARNAGLQTEIWVVSPSGDMRGAVPAGVVVVPLGSVATPLGRMAGSLGAVGRIAQALRKRRPHVFFSAGNQIHLFASLAWRRAHLDSVESRFVGRASNTVIDLASRRHGLGGMLRRVVGAVERFQYRGMDHIVAVAHELADDLVVSLDLGRDRIEAIPNGVDIDAITLAAGLPCDVPLNDNVPLIVGVGRLSRQKNFALLLRAFAKLRKTRRAHLVILGDGPRLQRKALERLIASLGVQQDVTLAGFQANPWAWMIRSDLFVLSSRWEGSSNALIEALACGCRIVATAIPTGVREVLDEGVFGALVPLGDVDAMARAMLQALDSERSPDRQRERARAFSLGTAMAAYVAMLHDQAALAGALQRSDT